MSVSSWLLLALTIVVVVWVTVLCRARLHRLHRLHRRTDAARAGLESALEQRAAVALVVADVLGADGRGGDDLVAGCPAAVEPDRLRAAVAAARSAGGHGAGGERASAENDLGRLLGALDRTVLPDAVLADLVDAEQLLVVSRSVHNDAVRDTLVLRSRRLVRWLHLAGTAPYPAYFDIADPRATAAPVTRKTPITPPR